MRWKVEGCILGHITGNGNPAQYWQIDICGARLKAWKFFDINLVMICGFAGIPRSNDNIPTWIVLYLWDLTWNITHTMEYKHQWYATFSPVCRADCTIELQCNKYGTLIIIIIKDVFVVITIDIYCWYMALFWMFSEFHHVSLVVMWWVCDISKD